MQSDSQTMTKQTDKYQIGINDLPGEIREMAKIIGLKSALKLVAEYGGESVYFHKYDAITRAVRDRAIRAEFNGTNQKELARKFNLTSHTIRQIIKNAG